jgi:hypothetical protein
MIKEKAMAESLDLPLLDHQLADDELAWVKGVYADFSAARASAGPAFDAKEVLREILGREKHLLPTPIDLSGNGVWRNGRNRHDRLAACVFLNKVELHRHAKSRTDQFPIYVVGQADAFSLRPDGQPELTPVTGGDHFHNSPGAPHAFLPKVGQPVGDDWEIAFIAITPRNLREDTQEVSEETKAAYQRVAGVAAPAGV